MRRKRKKYDLYIVISLALLIIGYFVFNNISGESRGIEAYSVAIKTYQNSDYQTAYQQFRKVPSASSLKEAALFRQARCATILGDKELAVKKYKRIIHSNSKSTIIPISEYNLATLLYDLNDKSAKKYFKHIIKKYPTSDYAIASEYYLGMITMNNLPKNDKVKEKIKNKALIHLKNYIEKSPDGRYAINASEEILKSGIKLFNYDNLLIAKVYYMNGEYEKAKTFLNKTTLPESWCDFVKNEAKLGNNERVRYYTEYGLKDHSNSVQQDDLYSVIDIFISTFPTRKDGISYLINKNYNNNGADYISYLNCNENVSDNAQEKCYSELFKKYPDGQFSAETLFNLILSKYLNKRYEDAQRLGFLHLKKFHNAKSTPAVTYFMGKISTKLKHYESANNYYKQVINNYPDSYYAYRANTNIYKEDGGFAFTDMTTKPVVFPYKKSVDKNLVIKLALLKDYDLVGELCKKDKFIQSWILYQKGNYTASAIIARNGMDEINTKPPFTDLRWRLVYPQHFYETVNRVKLSANPIILESIIKEESHFNTNARSSVGASGLMQLMPATYDEIVKTKGMENNIYKAENNIIAGSIYYNNLLKVLGSKDLYAISAYNGGIGSVMSWSSKLIYSDTDEFVEQIPYPETKNYVKKVLRTYWMYANIYQ